MDEFLKLTGCKNIEHLKLCIVKSGVLFTDPVTAETDFKEYIKENL